MTTGSMGISPMAAVEGVAGTAAGTTTGTLAGTTAGDVSGCTSLLGSAGLTAALGACGCVDGGMIELLDLHSGPRRCSGRSLAQSA